VRHREHDVATTRAAQSSDDAGFFADGEGVWIEGPFHRGRVRVAAEAIGLFSGKVKKSNPST
jgi:hypothetical protein